MPNDIFLLILIGFISFLLGIGIMIILGNLGVYAAKNQAKEIIDRSNVESESILREAVLEGKSQVYELKLAQEKENKEKRAELFHYEERLDRREDQLNVREKALLSTEQSLEDRTKNVNKKAQQIELIEKELEQQQQHSQQELHRIANLSEDEAKEEVLLSVEKQMDNEIATYIRNRKQDADRDCELYAREILARAIERYSQEEVAEKTVSVVHLPNEEMKGRIIGREGRNIRAFEQATGVDILVDDTPEVITLSCFNPIRREIARLSLETLMKDGRIQPGRIEEVVEKVKADIERTIQKAGEDALYQVGIHRMEPGLVNFLGRLKYRTSYGQNALQHSIEVAHLSGMMAAELGLNQIMAKRAGLLHDIGKAVDFEVEGTHVELGVRLAKKYNEHPIVINAIASHHGDTEKTHLISNIVTAADTLSAARPGARFENLENYIQRLEKMEEIANKHEGVEQTYAISAGRELRVMVVPEKIDDNQALLLARDIRDEIERDMVYPGQVKVTVIREVRKQEIAK